MLIRIRLPGNGLLVLALITIIYLLINLVFPRIFNTFVATYVIQPALWGLLACYILRLPSYRGAGKPKLRSPLIKLAIGIGAFQVYLAVIAGFFDKFGKSPNSFTLKGIIINLVFVSAGLIGMEISRAWLINRFAGGKPSTFVPVVIALLYTALCLSLNQLSSWGGTLEQKTQSLGSTYLPLFSENLMASFLALWGGAVPAMAYRGVLQAFNWFCPVLPNLNWALKALTGTLVPVLGLVIVEQFARAKLNPGKFRRESGKGLAGWVVLSAVGIVALWFSLGIFPVRPTVIISGSMRPVMDVGDIAIVAKVNLKHLKEGDVIQYHQVEGRIPVLHRIIKTHVIQGKQVFITKGDDNNSPDSLPVYPEQVVGKVVFVVPKAGWVTIAAKQLFISKADLKKQEEKINAD